MKKVALVLMIILLIFASMVSVYAKDEMQLEISKKELNPGDEFIVSVNFDTEKEPVYSYVAKISYDKDVFEVLNKDDFEEQENWSDITYNSTNKKFALINKTGEQSTNKILNIKFKVKDSAKTGETSISINNATASNSKDRVALSGASAKVMIIKDGLSQGESLPVVNEEKNNIVEDDEDISMETEKYFPWISLICVCIVIIIIAILIRITLLDKMTKKGKIVKSVFDRYNIIKDKINDEW